MTTQDRPLAEFPADDDEAALAAVLGGIEAGTLSVSALDVPRVAVCLGHGVKAVRRRAAGALAACIADGAIGAGKVEELLASDAAEVRWGAAYALGRSGHVGAAVLDAAFGAFASADADVRWAAASLVIPLARSSGGVVGTLRALVRSGSQGERKMALFCLGESGHAEGDVFVDGLRDTEPLVRVAAMTALVRSGHRPPAALAAVSDLCERDPEASVRRAAAAILRRLTPPSDPRELP